MSSIPKQITVWDCICEKCGWEWTTRTDSTPRVCSRCKSTTWNKTGSKVKDKLQDMAETMLKKKDGKSGSLMEMGGGIVGAVKSSKQDAEDYCKTCGKHWKEGCKCEEPTKVVPIESV